jgi:4-hydroxy-4-methyl-2-oxoglutarate aldolase
VTDGLARDRAGLVAVGLPIFCAGLSPNSPYSKGPGRIGLPVTLGGLRIETGDVVVADRDGAVIVPGARAAEVADKADAVATLEVALDKEVAEGRKAADAVVELMRSDRVRRV